MRMVPVRGHAEGLLERAAEVARAQADEASQSCQGYVLGQVVLDEGGNEAPLPSRQPSPGQRPAEIGTTAQPEQFVHEHCAESLKVRQTLSTGARDQAHQLVHRAPKRCVLEEQSWI